MTEQRTHAALTGRLLMLGCGSIGQAITPLVMRHLDVTPDRITIVTADGRGREMAESFGIDFQETILTRDNYVSVLAPQLSKGDFLLNLSVEVSSLALVRLAAELGVLYLDTCIEPWAGAYTDPSISPSHRSNYALRENALALREELGKGPTAVIAQGANPGLVSQLVKEALVNVANDTGHVFDEPRDQQGWAKLARDLGVKTIHVAERDTQVSSIRKRPGLFINTWSIDGFVSEGCQPAELGWGTHEKHFPADGRQHEFGRGSAIYLMRPGAGTRVRTWTPLSGSFNGFLVTHNESVSISDYLTYRQDGKVQYRPTVHYAYHPCDDAVLSLDEMAGQGWVQQPEQHLMMADITSGIDELGVLLLGHAKGAYWYGSQLSTDEARRLAPYNSATSLQVAAGVLGGMVCALEQPMMGLVEADQLDYRRVLEVAKPYLGPVVGAYGDWTPLQGRQSLFPEDLDLSDPWQFKNIRVV